MPRCRMLTTCSLILSFAFMNVPGAPARGVNAKGPHSTRYESTAAVGLAQQDQTPQPDADTKASEKKEREEKALAMVGDVISQAQNLKLPENRFHLQAVAADIMWQRDEKSARQAFREIASGLAAMMSSLNIADPNYPNFFTWVNQLRVEILQIIEKHDLELALEFLHTTHAPETPRWGGGLNAPWQQDLSLEVEIAGRMAARNPGKTLELAEKALTQGFPPELTNLLNQIQDHSEATQLAGDIVDKLNGADLTKDPQAAMMAISLYQMIGAGNSNITVDPQTRRSLLQTITKSALAAGNYSDQNSRNILLSSLQNIMPDLQQSFPAQAAILGRKSSDYNLSVNPYQSYDKLIQNGTEESLLDAAAKAPAQMRDNLYIQAAWKALNNGDAETAEQIVRDNISEPQRSQMLAGLEQQKIAAAAGQGKVDEVHRLMANLRTDEERMNVLLQLTAFFLQRGDKKHALQILDEAGQLLPARARNASEMQMKIQFAGESMALGPERSFQVLESEIDHINELVAAASVMDGFGVENFKDDEMPNPPRGQLGYMLQGFMSQLEALAATDFARALGDIDRFQRLEVRLPARLEVARQELLEIRITSRGEKLYRDGKNACVQADSANGFKSVGAEQFPGYFLSERLCCNLQLRRSWLASCTSQTNRPAGWLPDYSISFQNPDCQREVLGANSHLLGGPDVLRMDLHPRKGHEENVLEVL